MHDNRKLSRRHFLKFSATAATGLALAACAVRQRRAHRPSKPQPRRRVRPLRRRNNG